VRGLALWWRHPDRYDWLSDYLARRGLTAPTRYILAAILMMLAVATLLMMWSPSGPHTGIERTVSGAVIIALVLVAAGYLHHWPNRAQSQVFSVTGIIAIAASALADADPRAGMLGCAAFIGLAGYISFFHNARYLSLALVISVATAVICAVRVAIDGDPAMAISRLLVMTGGILAVPFCGQLLVNWLSVDALKSSTDALTGLRNRRGFRRAACDLLTRSSGEPGTCFMLTLIDLDGFKRVNDTYGHATGDMILIAVGDGLRAAGGDGAVVGRLGGEEFLVAESLPRDAVPAAAERLRAAIAATSWNVTASLGVATTDGDVSAGSVREVISGLITIADTAMYEAKRAGGNQFRIIDITAPRPRTHPVPGPDGNPDG